MFFFLKSFKHKNTKNNLKWDESGVSGFSGMGIVEWWNNGMVEQWNGGMDFFLIHFICLFVY